MSPSSSFSQQQIDYLGSMHFINRIDDHLRIVTNVEVVPVTKGMQSRVVLLLDLIYDDEKVDTLSFNLHNYSFDEVVHEARHIKDNEYLMQQVDNFLAGDIE